MSGFRKELCRYAADTLYGSIEEDMKGKGAIDAFFASGVRYISNACDHPNVFRFVNVDDPVATIGEHIYSDNSVFLGT